MFPLDRALKPFTYLLKEHQVRIDYTTNVSTEIYLFQMTFYTVQVLSD